MYWPEHSKRSSFDEKDSEKCTYCMPTIRQAILMRRDQTPRRKKSLREPVLTKRKSHHHVNMIHPVQEGSSCICYTWAAEYHRSREPGVALTCPREGSGCLLESVPLQIFLAMY